MKGRASMGAWWRRSFSEAVLSPFVQEEGREGMQVLALDILVVILIGSYFLSFSPLFIIYLFTYFL